MVVEEEEAAEAVVEVVVVAEEVEAVEVVEIADSSIVEKSYLYQEELTLYHIWRLMYVYIPTRGTLGKKSV